MAQHTVSSFDTELKELDHRIAEMGGLVEKMMSDATTSMQRRDMSLARIIIDLDPKVDAMQREIEENAILTIARRQPMAVDLRDIIAAIRTASDLERIGDLSKNIAKRVIAMDSGLALPQAINGLVHMSELVLAQLKSVLDAYTGRNADLALAVWNRDGDIDALYTSLFREVLTYMMEDPRNIGFSTHLLFSAKNIERIGDHATNIAETVYFMVTGTTLPADRPKGSSAAETSVDAA
ncbi:MAG: phosphate signaling complex protein PhoU [Beijerinckiaceae bacterium]|nr:phosphate signaling complex protein PhoU [Beijerinckiaceae bacterium]